MNFEDVTGRTIDIGDIILYTMSTQGSAAQMEAGEVVKFNPKSIVVQRVDPGTFRVLTDKEFYYVPDGPPQTRYAGTTYQSTYQPQKKEFTGVETPKSPQLIPRPEPYRFYILRKI